MVQILQEQEEAYLPKFGYVNMLWLLKEYLKNEVLQDEIVGNNSTDM